MVASFFAVSLANMTTTMLETFQDREFQSGAILMIDDSMDDIELARLALDQVDVAQAFLFCGDPVNLTEQLNTKPRLRKSLRLVLLDINMPRLNGMEVLRALRAHPATRDLNIVVMTTGDDPQELALSRILGATAHHQKPVSFADFLDLAEEIKRDYLD